MNNTPNLAKYIADHNRWAQFFKQAPIHLEFMTRGAKKELEQRIECDLSPENLCCDGEASPAYVRQRGTFLRKVQRELQSVVAV